MSALSPPRDPHEVLPVKRRRSSFLAQGSPTSRDGFNAQGSLPRLSLRNNADASLLMQDSYKSLIEMQCCSFNRYATYLGSRATSGETWASADAVQDNLRDIEEILAQAEDAIKAKTAEFERNVKQFTADVAAHADPKWYRLLEDLTAFDDSKLVETLNKMRIADVRDFADYLKETLPAAAKAPRPDHEYIGRSFVGKVHLLLERVLQESRNDYSIPMSLFVVVKAKVLLLDHPRVHPRFLEREQQYVDDTLILLVQQHSEDVKVEEYWDLAASWRELVYAWQEMASDPGALLRLLGPLARKAQFEIRYRTSIAVAHKLPAELADAVFEQAMLVEEVPVESD